ncbi:MAG TPA: nitrilase-related carbon-nitrogen hydrolase [Roseovarius sp.]
MPSSIGPEGTRLGGHRKLILPPGFERDHFAPGHGCSVFEYRGIKIGTLICYDAEFSKTASTSPQASSHGATPSRIRTSSDIEL